MTMNRMKVELGDVQAMLNVSVSIPLRRIELTYRRAINVTKHYFAGALVEPMSYGHEQREEKVHGFLFYALSLV